MKTEIKYFFFRLYLRCIFKHRLFQVPFKVDYYTTGDWLMAKPNIWLVNMGNQQFMTLQDFKKYIL